MFTYDELTRHCLQKIPTLTEAFERLFHGRGGCYSGWEFLTLDAIDKVLSVNYFADPGDEQETQLNGFFKSLFEAGHFETVVLQRRYRSEKPSGVLFGQMPKAVYAIEDGLKYKLELLKNQNSGFFADMKIGRQFVREQAKGKRVLNLFSYTCAFSVAALKGGASSVVNVDMSKAVLETGRQNHRLNDLEIKGTRYMPYNILKSFSRIRQAGPYDLIIIDPPSFQKGSFAATKDYAKIIRRLKELASEQCTILSALNSPHLGSDFIKALFASQAPEFHFEARLPLMESFPDKDDEMALKNLIFKNF